MILRILDGPGLWPGPNPRYRGVYREEPTYCNALPAEHELNRQFLDWFLVEGGEEGVVRDLGKAVRYAQLCNEHLPGRFFEIVEVTEADALPEVGGRFLGFDLSWDGVSSILHGGHQSFAMNREPKSHADVLWKVMQLYFRPRLNEFDLFQRREDASLCLETVVALQSYEPAFFEGGDLSGFRVMAIYLVWGQDNWPPVPGGEAHWQPGANPRGASALKDRQ
jgi:hypothetical protein